MLEKVIILIMCHLVGDYVLQSDFIARTKGENWYHLLVHCALYCIPFAIMFGLDDKLLLIFLTHFWVDTCKSRLKGVNYVTDQILHYMILIIYLA